jgi:hypothetical protein
MSSLPEKSNVFISGFMLANFLQLVNLEQKTCTLKVSSKDKFGYLYFNNGELINAEADGMDGEQAATTIISWQNAQAEVENSCKTERKVYTPLMHILLNSTRHADENGTIRGHPDILDEAIQQAEAHHLKKAKLLLSKVLNRIIGITKPGCGSHELRQVSRLSEDHSTTRLKLHRMILKLSKRSKNFIKPKANCKKNHFRDVRSAGRPLKEKPLSVRFANVI